MDNPYFFQTYFFSTKCAPFLLKIEKDLTLMIRRAKGLEVMKIIFIIDLSTFGSNMFFDYDNYGF
jgi:hypothetical protein